MNKLKSHFRFNKQERTGIFFLLLIIVLLQAGFFLYSVYPEDTPSNGLEVDKVLQVQIDALKQAALQKDSVAIYPFNPNFITDYKGYTLGMSTQEIDRLHTFRKQNKFANTPEEFQKVTRVSDSLLAAISPHFKFPEWTQKKSKGSTGGTKRYGVRGRQPEQIGPLVINDLNTATAEELRAVNGIGEKLSARIVKFRDRLGGFLADGQLYDVYGLEPEVVERTFKRFKVLQAPAIQKIDINEASAEEIAKLVYIQKHIAERIVEYRIGNGGIRSMDELQNIEGFPSDKISRIALYLSL